MILSRDQIKKYIEAGEILISPFNEDLLKAASYTFTLGNKLKRLKAKEFIDSRQDGQEFEEVGIGPDGYLLQPGEFVVCQTAENFKLGRTVACLLSVRGSRAEMGLDFLQSELFCEPEPDSHKSPEGGKLMLRTTNRGPYPVKLFPGIKTVKGIFFEVKEG
jgi:deoxycytidine triphosphate deaminase